MTVVLGSNADELLAAWIYPRDLRDGVMPVIAQDQLFEPDLRADSADAGVPAPAAAERPVLHPAPVALKWLP